VSQKGHPPNQKGDVPQRDTLLNIKSFLLEKYGYSKWNILLLNDDFPQENAVGWHLGERPQGATPQGEVFILATIF
jgi:hypothetical protein